jgi:hypothetical protein
MSWIPGWDSIAAASWWSSFYFWAGIGALLALGISEVVSHRYSERKDELVSEQQVAADRAHGEEMARLHLETAQANERAAEANRTAEAERLARLKIEARLAWRVLNDEAKARVTASMKPFAGRQFAVITYRDDPEANNLGAALRQSLEAAGLTYLRFEPLDWLDTGVSVEVTNPPKKALLLAANSLARALNSEGIATKEVHHEKYGQHPLVLFVVVGKKPPTMDDFR